MSSKTVKLQYVIKRKEIRKIAIKDSVPARIGTQNPNWGIWPALSR